MPLYGDVKRKYQREWVRARRLAWLTAAGAACVRCGSSSRLQVDHINPATKVSHRVWSWASKRREAELAKCQILCLLCHTLKTAHDRGY